MSILVQDGLLPSAPYSAFEHLWRRIIPVSTPDRKNRFMLMLTAYFDESGTHKNSKIVTVAGYLSTVQKWEQFELEWLALLSEYQLGYYHAVDAAHFRNEFDKAKGWDADRRTEFTIKAHRIIHEHTVKEFDVSIARSTYDDEPYAGAVKPGVFAILVNVILIEVGRWLTDNGRMEPIDYVFEKGVDDETSVFNAYLKAFHDIASGGAFHLRSLTFAEGKQTINGIPPMVQLQAADMNAYEINKKRTDDATGRSQQVGHIRKSLKGLRGSDSETLMIYAEELRLLFSKYLEIEANNDNETSENEKRRA